MPPKVLVLCSLMWLQCTLGQCTDLRISGFSSFPTIPADLLALENYGAVDFLASPVIESIKPSVPSAFFAASTPDVACDNLVINSNPYAIKATKYESPSTTVTSPINFEVPYIIDQVLPPPIILDSPITFLDTPLEPLIINYPIETVSVQNSLNPLVSSFYVEEAPISITSLPSIDISATSNVVDLNKFVNPVTNTLVTSTIPAVFNPALKVKQACTQDTSASLGNVFDVLGPKLLNVPVIFEPPVFRSSYALSAPVSVGLPLLENIPKYAKPQTAIPTPLPDSLSSTITNIKAIFPSLPTFTPSSRVRNLGGIKNSDLSASRGNGLIITSSSPNRLTGVSIRSENTYQGPVSVSGVLPFLGTVGFRGSVPSSGYGTVNYRCGAGNIGMFSEPPNSLNSFYPRS